MMCCCCFETLLPSQSFSICCAQPCVESLVEYDVTLRSIMSEVTNKVVMSNDRAWTQASLSVKLGRLGVHSAVEVLHTYSYDEAIHFCSHFHFHFHFTSTSILLPLPFHLYFNMLALLMRVPIALSYYLNVWCVPIVLSYCIYP